MKKIMFVLMLLLTLIVVGCDKPETGETAQEILDKITLPTEVDEDFNLPNTAKWTVKSGNYIKIDGLKAKVTLPDVLVGDSVVILTATVTALEETLSKDFNVTVKAIDPQDYIDQIKLDEKVTEDFNLPSKVIWTVKSGSAIVIDGNKAKVTRPAELEDDAVVVLTASINVNGEEVSKDFTITVLSLLSKKNVFINGVELPNNYQEFLANKSVKENKRTEFYDLTQGYLVGTDNSFSYKPETSFLKFLDGSLEPIYPAKWNHNVTVFVLENEIYVPASEDLIEEIDIENCTIDFTEQAIGKKIKLEVYPEGLTESQLEELKDFSVSYEIEIVKGYNVYDIKELSYFDKRDDDAGKAWDKYQEENGLDKDANYTALILHTDLNVTMNDIPSYFYYTEAEVSKSDSDYNRVIGSLKDRMDIYQRKNDKGENFALYGNYFTIDASTLTEVVRESGEITPEGQVISHTGLLIFEGSEESDALIRDLYLVGNAPRIENAIKAGGLISIKSSGPKFTGYNNITICSFIAYFAEDQDSEFIMDKVKAYDAFNSFIYNYGSPNVILKNSEMIGAGGPVIIQDFIKRSSGNNDVPGIIITDCNLESYVTGSEGWFNTTGSAALVPAILQLDLIFNQFNRSFLKTSNGYSYMNFLCVTKSSSAQSVTNEKVSGSYTSDGSVFNYGKDNPYLSGTLDQTFALGAPTFQTNTSTATTGWAYFDGTTLVNPVTPNLQDNMAIATGDELAIYFNGMMIVLGYYPMGEQIVSE